MVADSLKSIITGGALTDSVLRSAGYLPPCSVEICLRCMEEGNYKVYRNCLSALNSVLSNGADPNQPLSDGTLPLFWAVDQNDIDLFMLLVEGGANYGVWRQKDGMAETLATAAVSSGMLEDSRSASIFLALDTASQTVLPEDCYWILPLRAAIRQKKTASVHNLLLDHSFNNVSALDNPPQGFISLIEEAERAGDDKIMELMEIFGEKDIRSLKAASY